MEIARILVPLDGSSLAEAAVPAAVELAQARSAAILLLRIADAYLLDAADPVMLRGEAVREEIVGREAEQYLAQAAARLVPAGLKVEWTVWHGPPAAAIIRASELLKPGLIVMTSHGRSGLGRVLLGSVAEAVLRGTRIPILLLRPSPAPSSHGGEAVSVHDPTGSAQGVRAPGQR